MSASEALSSPAVAAAIARGWGLEAVSVVAHHGGMNSLTWLVSQGQVVRWVAKSVPPGWARRLDPPQAIAARVEAAGIPAGAAVPMLDGPRVAVVDGWPLALLTFVDGVPLEGGSERERRLIGTTLARAHAALRDFHVAGTERFHWVNLDAGHLGLRAWLRPSLAAALDQLDALPVSALTSGTLHGDPAPEAFRLGATGACGLIDWAALSGPLMYDVASAVMYLGGPERGRPLVDAYLAEGVLDEAEVRSALPAMLRFRWAVQADYFARRIVNDDLTGIATRVENEKGLEDARIALTGSRDPVSSAAWAARRIP